MTFEEFLKMAANISAPAGLRRGQFLFNGLYKIRPAVADRIRGSIYDPFHLDSRLPVFWDKVEEYWDTPEVPTPPTPSIEEEIRSIKEKINELIHCIRNIKYSKSFITPDTFPMEGT